MSFNTKYSIRADELTLAAEQRGFGSVWFPEHTHIPASRARPYPGGGDLPEQYIHMSDPCISCMAVAAVTSRINVGTGVCPVPEHEPLALAKMVASPDRLSNGRFLFGVGAGWIEEEMENHGTPFDQRWTILEERARAMEVLWTQEEASFHGEWVNFYRVWSYPQPVTQPQPPVIPGTFPSPDGRQRVAEFGDGWIPINVYHKDLRADVDDLHARVRAQGRDPARITLSMFDVFATSEDDLKRCADDGFLVRAMPACPTAEKDTVLRWLDKYVDIGRRVGAL